MIALLLTNAAVVLAMMLIVWLISIPLSDVSIVDLVWGMGFVLVAWTTFGLADSRPTAQLSPAWLLPLLTTIWGLRLSAYLAWRNVGRGEDKRYVAMRAARPKSFWWQSLLMVFGLQAVVMWIISLPLQFGIALPATHWTWLHLAGAGVWIVGLIFESVGDWQLVRFKQNPENSGQVCDRGLWRYTRHPNYFGDFCIWWGLYLVAIAAGQHVWTIISPILMSLFLMKVSGVTLLEQTLTQDKPGYADYIRRTNAFFPGLPRTDHAVRLDER